MTLCKIRDKSFDERQFADVLEYLDAYVLAQMFSDLDMKYEVVSGGQNHAGNIHMIIVYSRALSNGFKLTLYENQSLKLKGVFNIRVNRSVAKERKLNRVLSGFKVDYKFSKDEISCAVKLDSRLQYVDVIEVLKDYLDW